ncbi:hypothetical protein GDO86_018958 [Hymenochirus boettgeri]|uniref:G-protein coupled receptors family 1 profile domain-containing protein n=1 Tax=Hymenochirus boettgeri TaxID=247094 RepID=A0A8T2IHN4_9PIPI|nr:hypothetical protein GDO86_018958 [Hymenochirus boettgeri]
MNSNHTIVTEIVLLGFQNLHNLKVPLFLLFLLIYILTVCENVLIIVLVSTSRILQSPMYFFLQHLSLCDLLQSTNIAPILLQTFVDDGATISLAGCLTQFYFFGGSGASQCLLLALMAYDRYLAICHPLRYNSIMNHRACVRSILITLVVGFSLTLVNVNAVATLRFCEQNTINHFFCDFYPLLELSCSDISFVQTEVTIQCAPLVLFPFILIVVSYIYIAQAILKIISNANRKKAFSTCSSHLAVVSIFYGTLSGVYVVPFRRQSLTISKVLSLLYTVVIPFINPMIYSLRNNELKGALKKTN